MTALPALRKAIQHAQQYAVAKQYPEGYWRGRFETNTTMEAEYILMNYFLGIENIELNKKLVNQILHYQNDDGTWGNYYGAPGDLNTTIESYFALKLSGYESNSKELKRAREFILAHGGVEKSRIFTKVWLALFGQWPWEHLPALPPEIILLPTWFPLNVYDFSGWARAAIVPLSLVLAKHPVCRISETASIKELFINPEQPNFSYITSKPPLFTWKRFFIFIDKCLHQYEKFPYQPGRAHAIKMIKEWVLSRQQRDGTWEGIQPGTTYSLIALKLLGYETTDPIIQKCIAGIHKNFSFETETTYGIDAASSPIWDTCLMLNALMDSGMPTNETTIQKGIKYLLKNQILSPGDWQIKNPKLKPGGWPFGFANDKFPDLDDTAEVLVALYRAADKSISVNEAIEKGQQWVLGMQSKCGGWAGFDKDNTKYLLTQIPFFDFGDILDSPCVDITAHVLEAFAMMGYQADHPQIKRGLQFILNQQEEDGSWFGHWGVNYLYGTSAVLLAYNALSLDMTQASATRACDWLLSVQNLDGGWGESCASFAMLEYKGKGASTASQTAWALMGLISAGLFQHAAVTKGIRYLCEHQNIDGTWDELFYTGAALCGNLTGERPTTTNLPPRDPAIQRFIMARYGLYSHYWPLRTLGMYYQLMSKDT